MATMNDMHREANRVLQRWGRVVVGLYAWTTAVYFGFILLDMTYARLVVDPGAAFSTAADVLLALGGGMILLGMAAVVLAVRSETAMKFLIASVVVFLLMLPAPMLLSSVLRGGASGVGAPLRILMTACVSGLAFLGFGRYGS